MNWNWKDLRFLGVGLFAVACSSHFRDRDAGPHTDRVLADGKLTMLCFPLQYSSFVKPNLDALRQGAITLKELTNADAYEGSDIELVRGFADSLGVRLEIKPITTSYGALIASVAKHQGDLAASSLTMTEERERRVDFSDPSGSVWAVIATRLDGPMLSLEELAGRKIMGSAGSSQVEIFKRLRPRGADLVLGNFTLENYAAIVEGDADFMLMDSNAELGEPADPFYSEVKVMTRLAKTNYGVAFPPGSDLRERFNDYLARRSAGGSKGGSSLTSPSVK